MNNDGNGVNYRNIEQTSFGKGNFLERESVRQNYLDKMNAFSNANAIEAEIASLDKLGQELSKINKESKRSSEERLRLLNDLAKAQKELNDYAKKNGTDEKELLKLYKNSIDVREKALKRYIKNNAFVLKQLELQKEELTDAVKMQNQLSKSPGLATLSKNLKDFSKELSTLSQTLNLDKLARGNVGNDLRTLRRSTMSSMGLTSNQFNDFKNDVLSEVRQLNGSIGGSLYGLDDVKWYLSSLNDLGIHSTTLAEQQVNATIVGNKLLGLSVETQAQFIKTMKRTDNKDMLQRQNATIAALLKSNLDISKEQLALAASNTAGLVDSMAYLGLTDDALDRLSVSMTAGQASIMSAYGVDTNTAVYSLLSDLATNTVNSEAIKKVGMQGLDALESGNYGSALQAIFSSDYYRSLSTMNDKALSQFSREDQIIAAMVRNSSKMNWDEYGKVAGMSKAEAEKYLKDLEQDQLKSMTFQEKLENWFGTFFGQVNWKWFVSLADAAFGIYILSKTIEISGHVLKFFKTGFPKLLANIKSFGSTAGTGLSHIFSSWGTVLAAAGALVAFTGAFLMFKNDWNRAEEQHISPIQGAIFGTREGIENVLWSVGKYLLVGLGVALTAVALGASTAIIAPILAIAGVIGVIAGAIGAGLNKKESLGAGSFMGGSALPSLGVGGDNYTTSTGLSTKPWRISSRYGPRTPIKTANGWTSNFHGGIDLARAGGTPIGANIAGYITGKGYNKSRGNWVSIEDANGLKHTYMHMQSPALYDKGTYVNDAQIIGYVGTTGLSTGNHLHYQINKGNSTINPEGYITRNIMDASVSGNVAQTKTQAEVNKEDSILGKFISEDTRQKEAVASQYANYFATETGMGAGEPGGITGTVNKGFGSLIDKLDELSAKQADQERILAALTGKMGTSLYKY